MRRPLATNPMIRKVAMRLHSAGEMVSIRRVRTAMGGGSTESINKVLNTMRAEGVLPELGAKRQANGELSALREKAQRWETLAAEYRILYEREIQKRLEAEKDKARLAAEINALNARLRDILRRR